MHDLCLVQASRHRPDLQRVGANHVLRDDTGGRSVGDWTVTRPDTIARATWWNVCGVIVTWLPRIGNRKRMRATVGPFSTCSTLVLSDIAHPLLALFKDN